VLFSIWVEAIKTNEPFFGGLEIVSAPVGDSRSNGCLIAKNGTNGTTYVIESMSF
jgi:hypothetical protein